MGTRHLITVVKDGGYKVAQYGQWDGYLGGQGCMICEFLQERMDLDRFKVALDKCRFLTQSEIDELNKTDWHSTHGYLSRDTGANILDVIQDNDGVCLVDQLNFAGDSLFCEWAYVVDMDNEILEIYEGFNKKPLSDCERFFGFKTEDNDYEPVKLVAKYAFKDATVDNILKLSEELSEDDE